MRLSPEDRSAYLARIGFTEETGVPAPSIEWLRALHVAHLMHVPFENLDIHIGRTIELDERRIVAKIVHERRGGFCYELNGAFACLLESLGFEVHRVEARVHDDGDLGIAFDHLCLLVALDHTYLVDVGFGDSFLEPVPFDVDREHADAAGRFVIVAVDDEYDLVRDGAPQYRFTTWTRALGDFAPGCRHHQTSSTSHFTRRPVVTRVTEGGRVTLSGMRLIDTTGGERLETAVPPDLWGETLVDVFGLELSVGQHAELAAASGTGSLLFDTAIGRCGVGWVGQRIRVVSLPDRNDEATLARLTAVVGESPAGRPPRFVQQGIDAMVELLDGERRSLDELMVDLGRVPAFDRSVYEVARTIPPGEVMTYGAVAKRLGQPGAAQAVGGALGRNPVPLIVPCHRVVAADGRLGGFSANGGRVTKRRLLEIEGAPIDRSLF